jgi:hypothetical protein
MFLNFNSMNHIKRERIQKQLTKLLLKKNNLDTGVESEYVNMLKYILTQKTFLHYPKINTLLNIEYNRDNDRDGTDNNDDIDLESEDFNVYLSRLKSITFQDLDDSNLDEIKKNIKIYKDAILMNEHRKSQMNFEIKELRTEFAKRPESIINQINFEKQNLFNVIERINNLEANDNNEFIKEYDNLQDQILNIDNQIKTIQLQASNQHKILQNMRTQNLEIRNQKVKQIHIFKKQQITKDKERFELVKQKEYVDKLVNDTINNINNLRLKIRELKQNSNQSNLDSNLKQVDDFIKEKNRIQRRIEIFDINLQKENNKEKVVTKLEISDEKTKHRDLLLLIDKLNHSKLEINSKIRDLILDNMKYNNVLNKEYKRSEERILKVISRINKSFDTDRQCLQNDINKILDKIGQENILKKDNLEQVHKLENNINESCKDIYYLRQQLELINNKKIEIEKINKDINSYQNIIG